MKNILLILSVGTLFAVATVVNVYADNGGTDVGSGIFNAKVIQPLTMTVRPNPPQPSIGGILIALGSSRAIPINHIEYEIRGEKNHSITLNNANTYISDQGGLSITVYWESTYGYTPASFFPFKTDDVINSYGNYYVKCNILTVTAEETAPLGIHNVWLSLTVAYKY